MNRTEDFRHNAWPTVGVEIELQLIDAATQQLRSAIHDILPRLPSSLANAVKPEFMQCYVEITSDAFRSVGDVEADLRRKIEVVERIADQEGICLLWAATHPFSRWQDQEITPNDRYFHLADLLQETVIRQVTFGLHVHVGVESGDKAIQVSNRIQRDLPTLLALSANSPFWEGYITGHHAHRVEVLEVLPTGGLPPLMRSWAEYQDLVNQLRAARFIESHRDIWWDARPNASNGTLEVRICDMPPNLNSVLGLTALIQCLVQKISREIDDGRTEPECHPAIVRQNRWHACRYGLGARLAEPNTLQSISARMTVQNLVEQLRDVAHHLGCAHHLELALQMSLQPSGSEQQLALYAEHGSLAEMVRTLVHQSRISDVATPQHLPACPMGLEPSPVFPSGSPGTSAA